MTREHRRAGDDEAAELDLLDLGRDAVHRRAHRGEVEVALRVVERGLGLHVGRKLLQRQIGIAEQLLQRVGALLLDELLLRLRGDQCGRGVVEVELRADIALDQRILALDVALLELDAGGHDLQRLRVELDVGDEVVVVGLGVLQLGARLRPAPAGTAPGRSGTACRRARPSGLP